jgi:hypothetical protein
MFASLSGDNDSDIVISILSKTHYYFVCKFTK